MFLGPGVISMINEHWVRLCVVDRHSHVWPILARFMDYYSPFWRPRAISMIDNSRGAFACLSRFVDSDPFLTRGFCRF